MADSTWTFASMKPNSIGSQTGMAHAPSGLSAGESWASSDARPTARPGSTTFKLTLYPIPDGPDGIGRMPIDRLKGALNLLQCGFGLRASFVTEIAHGGTENEDDDD